MDINYIRSRINEQEIKNTNSLERYLTIVEYCMSNNFNDYNGCIEKHHILPRSLYPEHTSDYWNIIEIPARLHLVVHCLLHKAVGGKMTMAYWSMVISPRNKELREKLTPKQYELARKAASENMSMRENYLVDGEHRRLLPDDSLVLSGQAEPYDFGKVVSEMRRGVPNQKHKNMANVFDSVLDKNTRIPVEHIDYERFVPLGMMRDAESRSKTSKSLSDRYHCHNPVTGERLFLKNDVEIPDGFVLGAGEDARAFTRNLFKDRKHYYNPETGKVARFFDGDVPAGWESGRGPNFDDVNPFKGKTVLVNPITGERGLFVHVPRYHHVHNTKHFYCMDDGVRKIFTSSYEKFKEITGFRSTPTEFRKRDLDKPFKKGKFKGKTMRQVGVFPIKISDWDFENDDDWEWV